MKNFDTFLAGALRIANQDMMMDTLHDIGWTPSHESRVIEFYLTHSDDLDQSMIENHAALRSCFNLWKMTNLHFSLASRKSSYGKFSYEYPHSAVIDINRMLDRLHLIPHSVLCALAELLLRYVDFYHETDGEVVDYDAAADGFYRNYESELHFYQHLTMERIIENGGNDFVKVFIREDEYSDVLPFELRAEPINNMLQLIRFFRFVGNVLRINPVEFINYPDLEDAMNLCTQRSVEDNPLFDLTTPRLTIGRIYAQSDVLKASITQWSAFLLHLANPTESHIVFNAYDML